MIKPNKLTAFEPPEKSLTYVKYFICLLLWSYVAYRAIFLSLTQDEAHSYLLAKTDNWRQMAGTTNTHWLNTLFVRLMVMAPGPDSVWKLRLLSILSWPLYAFCAIKISEHFKNKLIGFTCFAGLVLNPFVLFYFSLERGYAPSITLVLLSVYLASQRIAVNDLRPARWVPVFVCVALASLFNFSAFYFFMALSVLVISYLLLTKQLPLLWAKASRPILFIVTSLSLFTSAALLFVRSRNELYYGGTDLATSMLGSMLHGSFYIDEHYDRYATEGVQYLLSMDVPLAFQYLGLILFVCLTVAFLGLAWVSLKMNRRFDLLFLALSICWLMLILNGVLNLLFDTPYLFSRTALVLYPLLVIISSCAINTLSKKSKPASMVVPFFLIFLSYNFYKSFSVETFVEWPVQTNTEYTLNYLQQKRAKSVALNPWDYALMANYFSRAFPGRYTFNYSYFPENNKGGKTDPGLLAPYDYIVLSPPYDSLLVKSWEVKAILPFSKTVILNAPENKLTDRQEVNR